MQTHQEKLSLKMQEVKNLELRYPGLAGWATDPGTRVLKGKKAEGALIWRQGHIKSEAWIGFLQLQAQEDLEPPEAEGVKKGFPPRALRGGCSPAET